MIVMMNGLITILSTPKAGQIGNAEMRRVVAYSHHEYADFRLESERVTEA